MMAVVQRRGIRQATGGARWSLLVLIGFVGMLPIWWALLGQVWEHREAYTACSGAAPSGTAGNLENLRFRSDSTFLPAGRQCVYEMEDGSTQVWQTGWPATIWALIGTGMCLFILVVCWLSWRRMSPMQRMLIHIAAGLAVLGWAAIAWFAALN